MERIGGGYWFVLGAALVFGLGMMDSFKRARKVSSRIQGLQVWCIQYAAALAATVLTGSLLCGLALVAWNAYTAIWHLVALQDRRHPLHSRLVTGAFYRMGRGGSYASRLRRVERLVAAAAHIARPMLLRDGLDDLSEREDVRGSQSSPVGIHPGLGRLTDSAILLW